MISYEELFKIVLALFICNMVLSKLVKIYKLDVEKEKFLNKRYKIKDNMNKTKERIQKSNKNTTL